MVSALASRIESKRAGSQTPQSNRLDDQKAVPVRVAEKELRRHRIRNSDLDRDEPRPALSLTRDLRVHVNASCAEGCVVSLDIIRGERAMSLVAAGRLTFARRDQGNCDRRARRATSIHRLPSA